MNRQAVIDIVRWIFTHLNYNASSSEICDLLVEKDNENYFIKYEKDPNINNLRYFAESIKKYGKGIVISDSFDEKIRMFSLNIGLTLWDRSDLETEIGRVILDKELGKYEDISPEHDSSSSEENVRAKDPEKKESEFEKTIKIMLRSAPINIGKQDAFSIAEAKIGAPKNQTLRFMPVWYYSYLFNTKKKYKSKIVDLSGKGEGYIHGITGENFFVKNMDIRESVILPTQNYEIVQPSLQKKDAAGKALSSIIREHTKEMRLSEMIGDTIVFENRICAPEPSEIEIKLDLLYIPFWEIKGKRELIDINGYDGHITGIKLFNDAEMV